MTRARVVACIVAGVALAGCGRSHGGTDGPLVWDGKPAIFKSPGLPNDRVLIGRVRNNGTEPLRLVGARLLVRDRAGHRLNATAAFTTTFAHGLYGALEQPVGGPPVQELYRLGKATYLSPGSSAPFYAAWRLRPGLKRPLRIDYAAGSLIIPAGETDDRGT